MKTAIVTGAAGNLGREVIRKFISQGYKVAGTLMPGESVDFPAEYFQGMTVDLLNEEASQKAVGAIIERNGAIDAAVLTVGGFAAGDIEATTTSDIQKQYKLNFETAYNIARPVFIQMRKQKRGRIFLVGSRPGLDGRHGKGMVAYSLAKSLLFRLAELMNHEGQDDNVVVSVFIPGTIDTPQNRKAMPDADFSKWVKAEEIAGVISFYCSNESVSVREPIIKMYGAL
ncbi:MAG TPA: SDR family NAD(P)-dependent oxidoreductase [Chitinophagaceae bacterium]|nr:SDR family NAD(P)-dependent oxidoreductase [Chitinophagaceae bacterium]